ncbi:MAG: indolepyruvate ferredoxin oxidoreductase subunit alpha [Coriobacteriia bacterium]|nr:indolepyruvate ferredoxin oxidoreductase subunit alpha [Coriobacteriia bacterium]
MARSLLSGNEAVARGAWEAGALVGVGYPGTPSTEVLEAFACMPGVYAEWAPNEKVALEVAAGSSLGGVRTLVTMKHVGLNVAADPLLTLSHTGVGAGLVLLVADDPGMHSSQNEQDSRNYAAFAKVPLLEPSDSAEALAHVRLAFDLSERFDLPVILRSTTRVAHSKGLVGTEDREERERVPYEKRPEKWVMMPGNARVRRLELDERIGRVREWAEGSGVHTEVPGGGPVGVVTSGVCYHHVREALPGAPVLKLSLTWPLPLAVVRDFAERVRRVAVVEEADDFLARGLRAAGIDVADVPLPAAGELTPRKVAAAFGATVVPARAALDDLPPRPPLMCPGCPHRGVFHALRRMRAVVTGDIGCYTLGALPPLAAMDTCVCMGASIGMAHGLSLAGEASRPVVAVIGDSTFAHSGVTGLMDLSYNRGNATVVVLDNRVTAMTGQQDNPLTGRTLMGESTVEVDVPALARALGIADVTRVDPFDLPATESALRAAVESPGPSVIVVKGECALLAREHAEPFGVDEELCTACAVCIRLGCPAISKESSGKAAIDAELCVGCAQCVQVCKYEAIVATGPACDVGELR